MTQSYNKLKQLLAELFQFDREDLDFGIYRIMNQKRVEVSKFLERDLLPQVKQAFGEYRAGDEAQKRERIAEIEQAAARFNADPEEDEEYRQLKAELAEAKSVSALENEVYSDLYTFFRRYYKDGDFLSLRRYKPGVYAIPYEGEEVKLHWANADQYYVKTAENFRHYRFKLEGVGYVSFELVTATAEQDNNKTVDGKERRFVLREESVGILERLMSGRTNLNYKGRDLFADSFNYLMEKGLTAEELYDSILSGFFNATGHARLHAGILKGAEGEISLHLGDNEPFGVINVGDPSALSKLLEEQEDLVVSEQSVSGSLFNDLNTRESSINLLVGARKFAEGWSSWRVSSMGLMNVGKNEGSQIIQLFGRGVRLKGLDFSLKRSSRIRDTQHPRHIGILETLNVFGVSADYMQQFKEHLEEEGLPSNDDIEEIVLPVINTLDGRKLKTIRLRKGGDFKKNGPRPQLDLPASLGDIAARKLTVKLDWYPKIGALSSRLGTVSAVRDTGKLKKKHLAFMDLDEVYFELIRHKEERGWHNLTLSREKVVGLLENPGWYELMIPSEDLEFAPGNLQRRVRIWQEIATSLLKAYCKKYYDTRRAEFESGFLQYQELTEDDPNFLEEYRFQVEASAEATAKKLRKLKAAIEDGRLEPLEWGALDIFSFDRHLYRPLVHLKNKDVAVKPVALNDGEQQFVKDLKSYYEAQPEVFEGRELYLLRNMSRGKGIGFFEAGNFYPDFILWLLIEDRQYVTFIDPKGITRLRGVEDPKIEFKNTIKEIEVRLGDPAVTLHSFIISNTPYDQVEYWGMSKEDLEDRHVLFQKEDKHTYIAAMFDRILI